MRLVAIAGLAVALDLALTGCVITADEAYRLGLVNRIVAARGPDGERFLDSSWDARGPSLDNTLPPPAVGGDGGAGASHHAQHHLPARLVHTVGAVAAQGVGQQ